MRASWALVMVLAAAGLGGCGSDSGSGERHGGLTKDEAIKAAEAQAQCPGDPPVKISRCEPRDDGWRCYSGGNGDKSYVTIDGSDAGAETAQLC